MRNKLWLLIVSCAVLAVLLSSVLLYDRIFEKNLQEQLSTTQGFELPPTTLSTIAPTTVPGDEAPDFTLTDTAGNTVTLAQLKGKPAILLFWYSRSADATAALSYMETLKKDRGDDVNILLINVASGNNETKETAQAFLADKQFSCPVFIDDGTVAEAYSVHTIPMAFFLNAEGMAKAYIAGAMDQASILRGLATVMPETTEP